MTSELSHAHDRDAEQLNLLGIFHYVVGGIAIVLAFCPSFHLAIGVMMLVSGDEFTDERGQPMPPEMRLAFGVMFTLMPLAMMIAGWVYGGLMLYAARCLQRTRRWMLCMVMAAVSCLFVPLGTILGVFTIIVLNRAGVRERFGRPTQAPTPA